MSPSPSVAAPAARLQRAETAAATVPTRPQATRSTRTDCDASELTLLVGGPCPARTSTPAEHDRLLRVVVDGLRAA